MTRRVASSPATVAGPPHPVRPPREVPGPDTGSPAIRRVTGVSPVRSSAAERRSRGRRELEFAAPGRVIQTVGRSDTAPGRIVGSSAGETGREPMCIPPGVSATGPRHPGRPAAPAARVTVGATARSTSSSRSAHGNRRKTSSTSPANPQKVAPSARATSTALDVGRLAAPAVPCPGTSREARVRLTSVSPYRSVAANWGRLRRPFAPAPGLDSVTAADTRPATLDASGRAPSPRNPSRNRPSSIQTPASEAPPVPSVRPRPAWVGLTTGAIRRASGVLPYRPGSARVVHAP